MFVEGGADDAILADPHRQGRPPRAAAHVAAEAAPRRHGLDGGEQESGRRFACQVAHRRGVADGESGLCEGLPCA